MTVHPIVQTISSLSYIEGITLGAVEIYEVFERASDMDLDKVGDADDRASERQGAVVY